MQRNLCRKLLLLWLSQVYALPALLWSRTLTLVLRAQTLARLQENLALERMDTTATL